MDTVTKITVWTEGSLVVAKVEFDGRLVDHLISVCRVGENVDELIANRLADYGWVQM